MPVSSGHTTNAAHTATHIAATNGHHGRSSTTVMATAAERPVQHPIPGLGAAIFVMLIISVIILLCHLIWGNKESEEN